jgi:hypothetical protein
MAITLNLNAKETIQLDPQSESWLNVCRRNSNNQRPCAIPKKYFEVLFAWGYVEGMPGSARISPTGLARLLTEESEPAPARNQAKKKKKVH